MRPSSTTGAPTRSAARGTRTPSIRIKCAVPVPSGASGETSWSPAPDSNRGPAR